MEHYRTQVPTLFQNTIFQTHKFIIKVPPNVKWKARVFYSVIDLGVQTDRELGQVKK